MAREQKPNGACRSDITVTHLFLHSYVHSFCPLWRRRGGLVLPSQLLEDSQLSPLKQGSACWAPVQFSTALCALAIIRSLPGLGSSTPSPKGSASVSGLGMTAPIPTQERAWSQTGTEKSCFLPRPQAVYPSSFVPASYRVKMPPCRNHLPALEIFRGMALGGGSSFHPSFLGFSTCGPGTQNWGGLGVKMRKKKKSIFIFTDL